MDIFLDKRSVRLIRTSIADAVADGDTETMREDIMDVFSDEQIEEIERHIDGGDFLEFLAEALEEWSGDDVDEVFELIESQLSDAGIDLRYATPEVEEEEEEEVVDAADDDADDAGDDDDDDDDELSIQDDEDV